MMSSTPAQKREDCTLPNRHIAPISAASKKLTAATWAYQLQRADLRQLGKIPESLLVVDYSRDGSEAKAWRPDQIRSLRENNQKIVLAYLSIGEAEDYRYYFRREWKSPVKAPCWLGPENPQWPGNFKVRYWSEEWQQLILGYLDKIIDQGFDGIYLDIVDAYEYWASAEMSRQEVALSMVQFIQRLAAHARIARGRHEFFLVPQNGEGLLAFDFHITSIGTFDLLRVIDGMGIEDLYYYGKEKNMPESTSYRNKFLQQIRAAGKPVFLIDYVYPYDKLTQDFYKKAASDGYIGYAAHENRKLDRYYPRMTPATPHKEKN